MYLLDTATFEDLVLGDRQDPSCAVVTDFVARAEQRRLRVCASVISIGMLRHDVSQLESEPERINWEKRIGMAVNKMEKRTELYDVDRKTAEIWSQIKTLPLLDANGEEMGDDERMVLATAVAHDLRLVTRWRSCYQPVIDALGLEIEDI